MGRVQVMNRAQRTKNLQNKKIETWKDVIENPEYLFELSPDDVAKKFGFTEIESSSTTGGRMWSDGNGNYFRYNPGNEGSMHGAMKYQISTDQGKIFVGGENFKNLPAKESSSTIIVVD